MTKKSLADLLREEHEDPTPTRKRVPTKADLEATLAQVQAELATAQALIQDQAQANPALDQLKAELAQTQQEALQLAQLNQRHRANEEALKAEVALLTAQVSALQAEVAQLRKAAPTNTMPIAPRGPMPSQGVRSVPMVVNDDQAWWI